MYFHLIQTYQPGPRLRSGSLTKAAIVRICKRLAEQWKVDVIPEPITDGFIQVLVPVGYKSCRLHASDRYPWLDGDEIKSWADDNTVVFSDLKDSRLYLKGFDGASWQVFEVVDIVRALEPEGIMINRSTIPRSFKPYMEKWELRDLWREKTQGLANGDVITNNAALGLLAIGGVDVTKEVLYGSEGATIDQCVDAYFAPASIIDPVRVVVGNTEFNVRRRMLEENSDVFKAMLSTQMLEGLTGTIDFTGTGISARSIHKILDELGQYKPRIPMWCRGDAILFGEMYICHRLL